MKSAPFAHATLIETLTAAEAEVAAFFGSLSGDELVLHQGDAWSPAGHLAHLNISVSATARGFSIPKLLLRLRFGRSRRPSRTLERLRADYLTRLASGAGATGRYVPPPDTVAGAPADMQHALLYRWQRVNDRLRNALMTWSERDLDRLQLPHPLLGRITARELVFFTIHHGPHHVAAAKRRLPRFSPEGSS